MTNRTEPKLNKTPQEIANDLAPLLDGDVAGDIFSRAAYANDASIYQIMPAAVVYPKHRDDVAAAVRYASEHGIPIVPRGAGSGLAGEALTSGIVLEMTRYMNKIVSIAADGFTVTCQPGAVLDDVNRALAEFSTKIGPDPSSSNRATIGGIVANNATGSHSLQYGYIADHVHSIEAVLDDGSIVELANNVNPADLCTERAQQIAAQCIDLLEPNIDVIAKALPRTPRNRSGYGIAGICKNGHIDLARLLAGSEGTLAVFTQITLKAVPLPKAKALLQIEFSSLEDMAKASAIIVNCGASACELMDQKLIKMAVDAYPDYRSILPVDAPAALVVEHTGESEDAVQQKIKTTIAAIGPLASKCSEYYDSASQAKIWKARKDAVPLLSRDKSDRKPIPFIEDVSVENRRLAEYVRGLEQIAARYGMSMAYYGHAGDGEMHVRPYLDLAKASDVKIMRSMADDVFSLAWSLGGTISGEHADGLLRAAFIKQQYGQRFYELLKSVKTIFDPHALLNPGKIINNDPDVMIKNLRYGYSFKNHSTNLFFAPDEFRLETQQCNGDGLCRSTQAGARMCPVFRAQGDELSCSRAKANLLRLWSTGAISDAEFESADFKKILDSCVNCKMCSVQCPSGVDVSMLIMEARAEFAKRKGLATPAIVLSKNRLLSKLASVTYPVSNFALSLAPVKWMLEAIAGIDRRRSMPKFQQGQFLSKGRKYLRHVPRLEQPLDKVAYFVDSYANYNDHELGFAVLKTLRHNNIDVILPEQLPAPIPAAMYGDIKTARADIAFSVKHLAAAVRNGYKIICSEPSAALCLKHELRLFDNSEDAKIVSENTYELSDYLSDLYAKGKLALATKIVRRNYAYHSPCHLCALGSPKGSMDIIEKLCGAKIKDLSAGCCGLAGTFGMQKKNYDLSQQIATGLVTAIGASEADTVLTECSACKMQLEHLTTKKAVHPIKILARAYGLI